MSDLLTSPLSPLRTRANSVNPARRLTPDSIPGSSGSVPQEVAAASTGADVSQALSLMSSMDDADAADLMRRSRHSRRISRGDIARVAEMATEQLQQQEQQKAAAAAAAPVVVVVAAATTPVAADEKGDGESKERRHGGRRRRKSIAEERPASDGIEHSEKRHGRHGHGHHHGKHRDHGTTPTLTSLDLGEKNADEGKEKSPEPQEQRPPVQQQKRAGKQLREPKTVKLDSAWKAQDESELDVDRGDTVVVKDIDDAGWAFAVLADRSGWIPLETLVPGAPDKLRDAMMSPRKKPLMPTLAIPETPPITATAAGQRESPQKHHQILSPVAKVHPPTSPLKFTRNTFSVTMRPMMGSTATLPIPVPDLRSPRRASVSGAQESGVDGRSLVAIMNDTRATLESFLTHRPPTAYLQELGILQEFSFAGALEVHKRLWRKKTLCTFDTLLKQSSEPPAATSAAEAAGAPSASAHSSVPPSLTPISAPAETPRTDITGALSSDIGSPGSSTSDLRGALKIPPASTQLEEAIALFNRKPEKGIAALKEIGAVDGSPASIANFLHGDRGVLPDVVGEFLSDRNSRPVLDAYLSVVSFEHLDFDSALRRFLAAFHLPGEAPKIDRLMEGFAAKYFSDTKNPAFADADAVYVLSFYTIMLNTDLHNHSVKKKISLREFISGIRGMNGGRDFDRSFLEELYNQIADCEIQRGANAAYPKALKRGWLTQEGSIVSKRRWFVLDQRGMYSFSRPHSPTPKHFFDIESMELVLPPGKRKTTRFHVRCLNETGIIIELRLTSDTETSYAAWLDAIRWSLSKRPARRTAESRQSTDGSATSTAQYGDGSSLSSDSAARRETKIPTGPLIQKGPMKQSPSSSSPLTPDPSPPAAASQSWSIWGSIRRKTSHSRPALPILADPALPSKPQSSGVRSTTSEEDLSSPSPTQNPLAPIKISKPAPTVPRSTSATSPKELSAVESPVVSIAAGHKRRPSTTAPSISVVSTAVACSGSLPSAGSSMDADVPAPSPKADGGGISLPPEAASQLGGVTTVYIVVINEESSRLLLGKRSHSATVVDTVGSGEDAADVARRMIQLHIGMATPPMGLLVCMVNASPTAIMAFLLNSSSASAIDPSREWYLVSEALADASMWSPMPRQLLTRTEEWVLTHQKKSQV